VPGVADQGFGVALCGNFDGRHAALVEANARDPFERGAPDHEHGRVTDPGREVGDRVEGRRCDEQRTEPEARRIKHAPHHRAPLGQEHPAHPQPMWIANVAVVVQARIADILDVFDLHAAKGISPRRRASGPERLSDPAC